MGTQVIYVNMKYEIKGFIHTDNDGSSVICINSNLHKESQNTIYEHLIKNVENGIFFATLKKNCPHIYYVGAV